jgi:glucan phosphorylase
MVEPPSGVVSPLAFSGIKRAKYERMLEENREQLRNMTLREVEDYLNLVRDRYPKRAYELTMHLMKEWGFERMKEDTDTAAYLRAYDQASRMAQEIAWQEAMES